MKTKVVYSCTNCGSQFPKWLGKCPDCSSWNSIVEDIEIKKEEFKFDFEFSQHQNPQLLKDVETISKNRISCGLSEFDRILGGGVVPGSLVLVGGDPGIGKSTLLLQVSNFISESFGKVLYVSGEESTQQTKLRAERLGLKLSENFYVLSEVDLKIIKEHIVKLSPKLVIIDSMQVIYDTSISSTPGSLSQVRMCTGEIMNMAKPNNVAVFLIGHVTKDGQLAGPKTLEHLVDTVLYFEGDRFADFRLLRAVKNRFGSTNEVGLFQMTAAGLSQITNPSSIFLDQRPLNASGSVVSAAMEGTRPILIEIQSLVSATNFGMPTRKAKGMDYNKVMLLVAVLEKRLKYRLGNFDVFINIAGGIEVDEPAIELACALSVISSLKDSPADPDTAVIGEVGLLAEVRAVSQVESRIAEAARLGFKKIIVPSNNLKGINSKFNIKLIGVDSVKQAVDAAIAPRESAGEIRGKQ